MFNLQLKTYLYIGVFIIITSLLTYTHWKSYSLGYSKAYTKAQQEVLEASTTASKDDLRRINATLELSLQEREIASKTILELQQRLQESSAEVISFQERLDKAALQTELQNKDCEVIGDGYYELLKESFNN